MLSGTVLGLLMCGVCEGSPLGWGFPSVLAAVAAGGTALLRPGSSLWWARLLMFCCGLAMAQVFVGLQTASFATIPEYATGRASTLFSSARQLGAAMGVAALSTVIGLAGTPGQGGGHPAGSLDGYRLALLVAAACCLACLPVALAISDTEAAATIPACPTSSSDPRPSRRPPPRGAGQRAL